MNKEKIIDAIYVLIFVAGISVLIWALADKNFLLMLGGFDVWFLMPLIDKIVKKYNLSGKNDNKKASE